MWFCDAVIVLRAAFG